MNTIESEQYVIGAILIDPSILSQVDLDPSEFYNYQTREIFSEMQALRKTDLTPDIITIGLRLQNKTSDNWLPLLATIQKNSYSTKLVDQHCKIIRDGRGNRAIMEVAAELNEFAKNGCGLENIGSSIKKLMALGENKKSYQCDAREICVAATERIQKSVDRGGLIGVSTGLIDLDARIGGFQETDLYVIGARPAMGKTAFLLNCMLAVDNPMGFISTEQGREQIGIRSFSITASVDAQKLRVPKNMNDFEWGRIQNNVSKLKEKKLWANDNPCITIAEIQHITRQWKYNYNIEILFVDYIQRIKGDPKQSTIDQVNDIVQGLKQIARELNIPVVALSQVARAVDNRPDKRPTMSDLSDSSGIEKEADVVMTLYRDEVYHDNSERKGILEILIEKNRHGPTGLIEANWVGATMQVLNLARERDGYDSF